MVNVGGESTYPVAPKPVRSRQPILPTAPEGEMGERTQDWLLRRRLETNQGMEFALDQSFQRTPEQAARILNLQFGAGLPEELIERGLDTPELAAIEADMKKKDFNLTEYRKRSPNVAALLSRSPNLWSVNFDKVKELGELDHYLNIPSSQWAQTEEASRTEAQRKAKRFLPIAKRNNQQAVFGGGIAPVVNPFYGEDEAVTLKRLEEEFYTSIREREEMISGTGKMGAGEAFQNRLRENPAWILNAPTLGFNAFEIGPKIELFAAAKAVEAGKATEEDKDILRDFGRVAEAMERRGEDVYGKATSTLMEAPEFVAQFVATGWAFRSARAGAEIALRSAVRKVLAGTARTATVKGLGVMAGAAVQAPLSMLPSMTKGMLERTAPKIALTPDEEGQLEPVLAATGDDFLPSLAKELGLAYIETLSEHTGGALTKFLAPVKRLVFQRWLRLNPNKGVAGFLDKVSQKTGWHGIIEESFEERVGDVLRVGIGEQDRILPSEEDFKAEVLAFAAMGAPGVVARLATSKRGPYIPPPTDSRFFKIAASAMKSIQGKDKSPEATRALVTELVGGKTLYVPAEEFQAFYQDVKDDAGNVINPEDKAADLGVPREVYQKAIAPNSKSMIGIPAEEYLLKEAATPQNAFWEKHATFEPMQPTETEEKEEAKERKAAEKKAEEVVPEQEAPKAPTVMDRIKESTENVARKFSGAMKAIGINKIPGLKDFSGKDVGKVSELFSKSVEQLAALEGITPEEYAARANVTPKRQEQPKGAAYGQPATPASPEFKAWFGDSKVVDESGKPLPVYHATSKDISEFNTKGNAEATGNVTAVWGSFFTPSSGEANRYTEIFHGDGKRVMPVFLSLKNPYVMSRVEWDEHAMSVFKKKLTQEEAIAKERAFREELEAKGHDGIIVTGRGFNGEYIAFHPEQIKSATGNRGTYDPNDPNILYQPGEEGQKRGFTQPLEQQIIYALTSKANRSTPIHELGHVWLILTGQTYKKLKALDPDTLTKEQKAFIERSDALLEFLEAKGFDNLTDKQHEVFAENVETWISKGKAPSSALRAAFDTFKEWMLKVYGALRGKVEMDPRITNFLERLLASQAEVAAAQAQAGLLPPMTEDLAGLSEATAAKVQDAREKVRKRAEEILGGRLIEGVTRQREKWWTEELERTKRDIEREVNTQPERIAESIMLYGKTPDGKDVAGAEGGIKLNWEFVDSLYGEETRKALGKLVAKKNEAGVTPGDASEFLGNNAGIWFKDADAFVNAMSNLENKEALVERLALERMEQVHGEPMADEALHEWAQKAVHNEYGAELMRLELQLLASEELATLKKLVKGIALPVPTIKEVRDEAEKEISGQTYRSTVPNIYLKNEQRAAKEAVLLFNKGDIRGAFLAKLRQLKNHELYRAAVARIEKADKAAQFARKLGKEGSQKRLTRAGEKYFDPVNDILERFEFTPRSERVAEERESLREWLEGEEKLGHAPYVPEKLKEDAYRRNYKDLTFEELDELEHTLRTIDHFAKLKTKLLAAKKKREFEEVRDALAQNAEDNSRGKRDDRAGTRTPLEVLEDGGAAFIAFQARLSTFAARLDGWKDGGFFWDYIVRPVNEAQDREAVMTEAAVKELDRLESLYSIKDVSQMWQKRDVEGVRTKWSHRDRLLIVLNTANEDNLQKLKDGYGFTDAEIQAFRDSLDARDIEYVNGTLKFINSYWPETKALAERVDGIAPEKVEGKAAEARNGTIDGGYFPLKYTDEVGLSDAKEAAKRALDGVSIRSTTKHAHRENRVKGVQKKIRLEPSVIFSHVRDVIHDLTHYEMLIDANRLLRDPILSKAIIDHHGKAVYRGMVKAVDAIAVGSIPARDTAERFANWLRRGTTFSVMAYKAMTSLKQPFGLFSSVSQIGAYWTMKGVARFLGNPARMNQTMEWIHERSDFMRLRAKTFQREINEVMNKVTLTGRLGVMQKYAFWHIAKMQQVADAPTWVGAYEKAMHEQGTPSSEAEAKEFEERAASLADQAVRDSQGSGLAVDLSAAQSGGPFYKFMSMFYTFGAARLNQAMKVIGRTHSAKDIPRLAGDLLTLYTIPATLMYLMVQALTDGDDDDQKELAEKLVRANIADAVGDVFFFREFAGAVQGFQYKGPAGFRLIDASVRLAQQIEQGELDEGLLSAGGQALGIILRAPSGQIEATIRGLSALDQGETENPAVVLTGIRR